MSGMKRRDVQGLDPDEIADLTGDPDDADEPGFRPGAGEFQSLLDAVGPDLEDDDSSEQESGVDEYTLMSKMPDELRPLFAAFLRSQKAQGQTAPQGTQPDTTSQAVQQLLAEMAKQRQPQTQAEQGPTQYKIELPEQFEPLRPLLESLVQENFGQVHAVKNEMAKIQQALIAERKQREKQELEATFREIKKTYGDKHKELSPIVGEILEENPELSLSSQGIARAFRMADKERKYKLALEELKAARRGGALPRSNTSRQAGRTAPSGLERVRNVKDAAKVAVRQMREAGFDIDL